MGSEAEEILGDFFEEPAVILSRGGGTASAKFIVEAGGIKYVLKKRREEFSDEKTILFDHSVILRLKKAGFPVAPPEEAKNSGRRYVHSGAEAWELFGFVKGLGDFIEGSTIQIESAGKTLGRAHRVLKAFKPEGSKPWRREFHPDRITRELEDNAEKIPGFDEKILARVLDELRLLRSSFSTERLSHTIVHGDYTSTNVKFKGNAVGGLFDFDWTMRESALYDIARGIAYFAAERQKPVDDGDIVSLVQPCRIIPERTELFMEAYLKEFSLTREDLSSLPRALKEFFIGSRVRALRKVEDSRKPELIDDNLAGMLKEAEKFGS